MSQSSESVTPRGIYVSEIAGHIESSGSATQSSYSSSQREEAHKRSLRRRQSKIEKRKRDYEAQKEVDGIYCLLTPIVWNNNLDGKSQCILNHNKAFVTNYDGAFFGCNPKKSLLHHAHIISTETDSQLQPEHFKISFDLRKFFLYDLNTSSGTFIRRSVFDLPKTNALPVRTGRVFLFKQIHFKISSVFISSSNISESKLTINILPSPGSGINKSRSRTIFASNNLDENIEICCPDDDENLIDSLEYLQVEDEQNSLMSLSDDDCPEETINRSTLSNDGSVPDDFIRDEENASSIEEVISLFFFTNNQFYIRNFNEPSLRVFSKVQRLQKFRKPKCLASGDIIKVGSKEFRVDIRGSPRPITDKNSGEILCSKGIGSFAFGNWSQRETMEDRHVIIDGFGPNPTNGYFAIFDGHAGRLVADFLRCVLHVNLLRILNQSYAMKPSSSNIIEALKESFSLSNQVLASLGEEALYSGSTAVCCLIWNEHYSDQKKLFVANVGDCRAYLIKANEELTLLSTCHLAVSESEKNRVQSYGQKVGMNGRIKGLTVSRAFGNLSLKGSGITCDPSIREVILTSEDKFLLLACDGVWDVIQPEEIPSIINPYPSCEEMAKALVHMAYKRGSQDNLTVIIVCL